MHATSSLACCWGVAIKPERAVHVCYMRAHAAGDVFPLDWTEEQYAELLNSVSGAAAFIHS